MRALTKIAGMRRRFTSNKILGQNSDSDQITASGRGPLAGAESVWLHLGRDEFQQLLAELPMEFDADSGRWKATFAVPESPKWHLAFCFRNAAGPVWHNNHTRNWQALVAREW